MDYIYRPEYSLLMDRHNISKSSTIGTYICSSSTYVYGNHYQVHTMYLIVTSIYYALELHTVCKYIYI